MGEDPWQSTVTSYVAGRASVRIVDVLFEGLFIPRERLTKVHEMRVANVLKAAGWTKTMRRQKGDPTREWHMPGLQSPNHPENDGQGDLLG